MCDSMLERHGARLSKYFAKVKRIAMFEADIKGQRKTTGK
jgi:hypothetical protein